MAMSVSGRSAGAEAERALALSYAPAKRREALAALFGLDDALANVLRTTREPAVGQIRLAWWREALARLDSAPAPAEPVLTGLAAHVLPLGVSGASLVPIVHGWEVLIEESRLDDAALRRYAGGRGQLFVAAGTVVDAVPADPLERAGQGWALADLALNLRKTEEAGCARRIAAEYLPAGRRWSRAARALGALAQLAQLDLAASSPPRHGAPHRVGRLLWLRLTGR